MSMSTYPLTIPVCFLIDKDVSTMIQIQDQLTQGTCPEAIQNLLKTSSLYDIVKNQKIPADLMEEYNDQQIAMEILEENDINVIFASEFDGEANTVLFTEHHCQMPEQQRTDGSDYNIIAQQYNCDFIVVIEPEREPSLFHTAYESPEELYNEFKHKMEKFLPPEFPYWRNTVSLYGTYFA